jgi:hypothetical protein
MPRPLLQLCENCTCSFFTIVFPPRSTICNYSSTLLIVTHFNRHILQQVPVPAKNISRDTYVTKVQPNHTALRTGRLVLIFVKNSSLFSLLSKSLFSSGPVQLPRGGQKRLAVHPTALTFRQNGSLNRPIRKHRADAIFFKKILLGQFQC